MDVVEIAVASAACFVAVAGAVKAFFCLGETMKSLSYQFHVGRLTLGPFCSKVKGV